MSWGIAIDMTLEEASKLEIPRTEQLVDWIPFKGAESRRMLYDRLSKFLNMINKRHHELVIVVSHGNSIKACIFWWLEIPLSMQSEIDFDIDTSSITYLRVNEWGVKTLAVLNSTDHFLSLRAES